MKLVSCTCCMQAHFLSFSLSHSLLWIIPLKAVKKLLESPPFGSWTIFTFKLNLLLLGLPMDDSPVNTRLEREGKREMEKIGNWRGRVRGRRERCTAEERKSTPQSTAQKSSLCEEADCHSLPPAGEPYGRLISSSLRDKG